MKLKYQNQSKVKILMRNFLGSSETNNYLAIIHCSKTKFEDEPSGQIRNCCAN